MTLGRLLRIGLAYWLLRWAAGELAAYAGRHWRAQGPPPIESAHPPGWMPGPGSTSRRGAGGARERL